MNLPPSYYTMNSVFFNIPVPPMHQAFLPMPAFQHQYNQNTRFAKPSKPLARKRNHACPVRSCGKRFTTSGNLSRHKRLHGKIDPLNCPVDGCVCEFPSANKLERHLKFHYGGDVKVCHVEACGRTFSTTGNLNRHMKKHHGGVASPTAATSVVTPTHDYKTNTEARSPCASISGESGTDSDTSVEPICSTPSETGASVLFDCVWNTDLLDTLACILDGDDEPEREKASRW
ncbi:hypothetical protein F442_10067 [Phytophthora nicotianae P10297]|uniref:C2H2-type domain-containing protein n=1 Tax=Phytophthora nicotianae P10297 TaxID=1317064 RepID=W2ZA38_PHYNI|nr:hypothetical protein F442_10067 [Phytophthora nicotianae P10297]